MNTYENATAIGEAVIDNSIRTMQRLTNMQEQADGYTRTLIDQGRQVREDGNKVTQRWAEMARENNKQMQQLVNSTLRLSMDSYRNAQQKTVEELTAQVDRLTKQVQSMTAKQAKA